MRVALINNMNNCFFAITRHLRDHGIDAHLFVQGDVPDHFHPRADTSSEEYKSYTHAYDWCGPENLKEEMITTIKQDLEGFDFLIGCGDAPAFLKMAGINLDIFIPYGSDMYHLPFFQMSHPKRIMSNLRLRKYQRLGIKSAKTLWFEPSHNFQNHATKIGCSNPIVMSCIPTIYTAPNDTGQKIDADTEEWLKKFKAIRENNEIVIFHHIRHCWTSKSDANSLKGNDILLKGFKRFIAENPQISAKLVTFEYGEDVADSKKLIKDLGIEENVEWSDKMPRKAIMLAMQYCDIGVAELFVSYMTYGAIGEFMANKLSIIAKREDELYDEHYEELYPLYNVRTPSDISAALSDALEHKQNKSSKSMGELSSQWYKKFMIDEPLCNIIQLINNKNSDFRTIQE